ncbi:hypothetical protein [Azohydromonas caseinilytica]|uniref:Uncharacterized protein n=1 Tax=Azohydromonas caseinilytica TaxID=2728836 RepID=A0A848FF56_9BURK|nr:hypothetical protein [Azohydromonas caseinilytica]NML16893.1 hypothetical protein [Azohydromonas caseinilytica]
MSHIHPRARYRPPSTSFFAGFGPAAPARLRQDEASELESLADLLQHFWTQLNRARIQHLCQALSEGSLQALWRDRIREIQALIERVGVLTQDRAVEGLERVRGAVEDWEQQVRRFVAGPVKMADYCILQNRLETMARAIDLCVRMWQLQQGRG